MTQILRKIVALSFTLCCSLQLISHPCRAFNESETKSIQIDFGVGAIVGNVSVYSAASQPVLYKSITH
jgi:hypothetical protein